MTPANASTHHQFESVVSRRRKTPEAKEAISPTQIQPPPQMPHLGHMLPIMPTQPGLMHPPINGPPPVIPPPGVRPSFPPPPPFHHQPPRPPMPLPPPGFMPPSFMPQFPPQMPIDPMDEEAMDKNKQISRFVSEMQNEINFACLARQSNVPSTMHQMATMLVPLRRY